MVKDRVLWLDYAKAISISLVVMFHATLGVGNAMGGTGFMHDVIAFATPFRMPDFFLLSGFLVPRIVGKSWSTVLERRVLFYGYFYVLWLTIQFGFKAPHFAAEMGWGGVLSAYAMAFVQPFGTLWFIVVLPVFYVFAKATSRLATVVVLAAALALHLAEVHTGWMVIDEVSKHLFYFLVGYRMSEALTTLATTAARWPLVAVAGIGVWALLHAATIGYATIPGLDVVFALFGTAAMVATGGVLSRLPGLAWMRWIGKNTIVIYLAFFLPMAVSRTVLVKLGLIGDVGLASFIVWLTAMVVPVAVYFAIKKTGYGLFLFEMPDWRRLAATLRRRPAMAGQAA